MSDINTIKDQISQVLDGAQSIIDGMKDGDKVKLSELAERVGAMVGLDGDEILPFVTFFAHHADNVQTARGRNGGLYKGQKPTPAPKAPKKTKDDATTNVTSTTAPVVPPTTVDSSTDSTDDSSETSA